MISKTETRCFLVSKDVVVPLSGGSPVVLGRDPATCNFVLSDERVSRVHAMLLMRDNQYFVKDLNSSNGTRVNGRKIVNPVQLKPGDVVSIPPFDLEFVRPDYAQGAEPGEGALSGMEIKNNKLEGTLATLPVADLIQLLNATLQSGILTITDKDEKQADLIFQEGEVVQAHYDGEMGEEAVYALMRNRQGRFEFTKMDRFPLQQRLHTQPEGPLSAERQRQIRRRTQSLLLEGARLMDERRPEARSTNASGTLAGAHPDDIEFLGTITD